MSAEGHNNLLLTILRGFLILVLVFPVAPSLASMTSAGVPGAVNENCPEKMQSHITAPKSQVITLDTAMKDQMNCKDPCSPDGNCVCQSSCQSLSSSANPTFFNYLNIVSTNPGNRKLLFSVIEIHLQSNLYLPAFRPPIY